MAWQEQNQAPAQVPAPPQAQAAPPQRTAPAQNSAPPAAQAHSGPVIVIDPAHGGTDEGAQGQSGVVEKDVVLIFARMVRSEFERQGYRVVMTRNDDSNPSYEDRAAIANAYRDAIFISLHVSSTGQIGTVRVYSYQFSNPGVAMGAAIATSAAAIAVPPSVPGSGLVKWEDAQRSDTESSHRLADALQTALAQKFIGSPVTSTRFAVRELRSVAAPAIAVEVSSVSVSDSNSLLAMGPPLAAVIERSIQSQRPVGSLSGSLSGSRGGSSAGIAGAK